MKSSGIRSSDTLLNSKTWPIRKFSSLVDEFRYGTSNKSDNSGLPTLRIPNVIGGVLDLGDLKCVPVSAAEEARLRLIDDDLLFVRTNGNPDYVGRCASFSEEAVSASGFTAGRFIYASYLIRARLKSGEVDPAFIREFMLGPVGRAQLKACSRTSAGQYNINIEGLGSIRVPVPPIDDQRMLVGILQQTKDVRRSRQRSIALLDQLCRSAFFDMFGDLGANDRKWPTARVGDFVKDFQSGKNIAQAEEETSLRILKVSAVTSGFFEPTESKPVPLSYVPPQSHFVRDGDLLLSRANTSELVGATALVASSPPNVLLPDKIWRFVWYSPPRTVPIFVYYLFQQPEFRRKIGQAATGTSGSMKNVSQAKVLAITCGLPPLEMQKNFAEQVECISAVRQSAVWHHTEIDSLFASLHQRAFRGEL